MTRFQHPRAIPMLLGALAYGLTYSLVKILHLPALKYLPVERAWSFAPSEGAVAMGYYGLLLWASLAFGCGFALGHVPAVRRLFERPRYARLLVWACGFAYAFAYLYYLIAELHHWARH